jgi:hypothetical protein
MKVTFKTPKSSPKQNETFLLKKPKGNREIAPGNTNPLEDLVRLLPHLRRPAKAILQGGSNADVDSKRKAQESALAAI